MLTPMGLQNLRINVFVIKVTGSLYDFYMNYFTWSKGFLDWSQELRSMVATYIFKP